MSQSDDKKYVQQQPNAELTGLKNQVENNLNNGKKKDDEAAAEGIAETLKQANNK